MDHYPWHFQNTEICQYSQAQWACLIEGRALCFHMPRVYRFPVEYQWRLMEYTRWTGLALCCWLTLTYFLTHILTQSHHFIAINKSQVNVPKDVPNWWLYPSETLPFYASPEHHWLTLCILASIKLKGTIPVKIVLIKTSIYPCIRACFNWFFLFESKNIIELIWITGCFASIHQQNPDNTCCCQGNTITVFVCFSTINYFNAVMLVFTKKHTTVCTSQQYSN